MSGRKGLELQQCHESIRGVPSQPASHDDESKLNFCRYVEGELGLARYLPMIRGTPGLYIYYYYYCGRNLDTNEVEMKDMNISK